VQKLSYSKKGILKKWQEEYNKGGGDQGDQASSNPTKHKTKNFFKTWGRGHA
jgi:hypothetical protein